MREIDFCFFRIDGNALDEVKLAVGHFFELGVGVVEVKNLNQHRAVDVADFHIVEFRAGFVVVVFDLEVKILAAQLVGVEGIDVFHHQLPIGQFRRKRRTAQQFEYQHLRRIDLRRQFAHFVGLALVGVFVCNSQNLVVLQCRCQRYEAQLRVEGVFVGGQFAGVADLFVIRAGLPNAVQGACYGVDVADGFVIVNERVVEGVGGVGRELARRFVYGRLVVNLRRLAKVEERHNVAGVFGGKARVCYPNFEVCNCNARNHGGQIPQSLLVMVAEVMVEEEVSIRLVVRGLYLKFLTHSTGIDLDGLGFAFLLREDCGGGEFAKFEVGLHTKQRRASLYQRTVQRHRNVAKLNALDDFVGVSHVLHLLLVFKLEGGFGVVIDAYLHLVANRTRNAHLHRHIKIE